MAASAGARPSDVREDILRQATRLFAAQGFGATSVQEVAEAVGIRKASLLYHFASKEELRQAVLDQVLAQWKESLPTIMMAATAGEGQFEGVTRELVNFFLADPDRARLIVREALDRPDDMRERLARHVRPVVANLSQTIKRGQRHGALHGDVDAEAYLFQSITLYICGVAFTDTFGSLMPRKAPEGAPRERLVRELLRMGKSALFRPGERLPRAEAPPAEDTPRSGRRSAP